jgi:apolipoprotein D and lipocalin family protein
MACTGFGCGAFQPPLEVVEFVDLERYTGKWYEIARYPNLFEQNCVAPTAEYTIREDGDIDVVNTCRKFTLDGDLDAVEGVARVVDSETNAKLKVRFFGPFEGDYWIIDLDSEYNYAVVGAPNRRFLWILSRTPTMDPQVYEQVIAGLPELGYDPNRLLRTTQIDSNP